MQHITLLPDFDTSEEEIRRIVAESYASGEKITVEVPIAGRLYLTDTGYLVEQFLYAAYIGQSIAEVCKEFECKVPSAIDAHETVEFIVLPKDVDEFVEKLWDVIPGFMSEGLLEQTGHDEMSVADIWEAGSDFLDNPKSAPHVRKLVEHARAILATTRRRGR
jgi:hypothetical protein